MLNKNINVANLKYEGRLIGYDMYGSIYYNECI